VTIEEKFDRCQNDIAKLTDELARVNARLEKLESTKAVQTGNPESGSAPYDRTKVDFHPQPTEADRWDS